MNSDAKFHALVLALQSVGEDIGIYPAAVRGLGEEKDYEQRDGFKNGWNAALIEHGQAFNAIVEKAAADLPTDLVLLLAADVGFLQPDGSFFLNFNDTWGWACADGEVVPPDEIKTVARLFRAWGWPGLLYWATTKRAGLRSEFKDNNRFIDFVAREEALIAAVPDSNKRAYMDLPPVLVDLRKAPR